MRLNRTKTVLCFMFAFGLATALAACSSTGGSSGPRRDPNLITAEELSEYATLSALDVVRRLRPRWLTGRGQGTGGMNRPQVIPGRRPARGSRQRAALDRRLRPRGVALP